MKPKIFIAMHYMEIGGAESSLIGLLEALNPERVDIDLFIYQHTGELMPMIPKWVNLLPEMSAYASLECPMGVALRRGQIGVVAGRMLAKWRYKSYRKTLTADEREKDISVFPLVTDSCKPFLPSLHHLGEYDLAISYLQPHDIVRKKVKAKKYLAWIHTDYSTVHVDHDREVKIWGEYDYINSISPECTKGFVGTFPELKDKIVEIENILPKSLILSKAEIGSSSSNSSMLRGSNGEPFKQEGVLTLCSVGRIGYAKNYDNVPRMAAELKKLIAESLELRGESGELRAESLKLRDFRWYIVGPGDHSEIDRLSDELGVRENVIFLGASDNPYPFINNCDIYMHPSRYEGKSIVVREAQVLCKPVIITNYPTAKSQIQDGVDGVICGMDNKAIAEAIYNLVHDDIKKQKIISYLCTHDMSGQDEVNKIYKLLG